MKRLKKALAAVLAAAVCVTGLPMAALAKKAPETDVLSSAEKKAADVVKFNTGSFEWSVVDKAKLKKLKKADPSGDFSSYVTYDKDGRYQIQVETDAFFPYEVQFSYKGKTKSEWFLDREDTVKAGGHEFYLSAPTTGNAVTSMRMEAGGKSVVVYPQKKEFTNGGKKAGVKSLLPLKEERLQSGTVDFHKFTPVELSRVSVSVITGGSVAGGGTPVSVMWRDCSYSRDNNSYQITDVNGTMDLCDVDKLEMIFGEADQLNAGNTRYLLSVNHPSYYRWLEPEVTDTGGGQKNIGNGYYDDFTDENGESGKSYEIRFYGTEERIYMLALSLSGSVFPNGHVYSAMKVYEGKYQASDALPQDKDITNRIWKEGGGAASGYAVEIDEFYEEKNIWVTFVTEDAQGKETGRLPVRLELEKYRESASISSEYGLYQVKADGTRGNSANNFSSSSYEDDIRVETYTLYSGLDANQEYFSSSFHYNKNGKVVQINGDVYAYIGNYNTLDEAKAAGAADVTSGLFSQDGYKANYSSGITFTIFYKSLDGTKWESTKYRIKAEAYGSPEKPPVTNPEEPPVTNPEEPVLNSGTDFEYEGILQASGGSELDAYILTSGNQSDYSYVSGAHNYDSYGEGNFFTVLVENGVDLTNLILKFSLSAGATIYDKDTQQAVVSGVTPLDFSKGARQLIVSSEDKENFNNYFIRALKAGPGQSGAAETPEDAGGEDTQSDEGTDSQSDGADMQSEGASKPAELYIMSLDDDQETIHKTEEGGVVKAAREVFLDSYHDSRHDILVANIGYEPMEALKVELQSSVLELDKYWTLKGAKPLGAFTAITTEDDTEVGQLPNLAMVRLIAKGNAKVTDSESLGTISFSFGGQKKIEFSLTGIIGDPCITTTEITRPATQYVPYGMMITNNNKYKKNHPYYSLAGGTLPEGMHIASNGELYGVPKETGTFTFTVRMVNGTGYGGSDTKELTLTVRENTDDNVISAQDPGYELQKYFDHIGETTASGDYYIESEGEFSEFLDLYIDGELMEKGTDYTAEEGSTCITIASQSLNKKEGTHTIGVKFRSKKDNLIKAAAHNYRASNSNNSGGSSGGWTGGWTTPTTPSQPSQPTQPGQPTTPTQPSQPTTPTTPTQPTPPAPPEPQVKKEIQYAVNYDTKAGDTLKSIAKLYYGTTSKWEKIYNANKGKVTKSGKLKAGIKLVIPALNYRVEKGDTLKDISQKYYGAQRKWSQIYEVNKDIVPSSGAVNKGMRLVIPFPVCRAFYAVKKGDTLQSIAKKYYGKSTMWEKIYEANKGKADKSGKVKARKKLRIPTMVCTTKKGDTLKSVAKQYYGAQRRWTQIYEANKDVVSSSGEVKAGAKLVIPVPVFRAFYVAKKGDTLKTIAKKYYGKSGKWKKILEANKGSAYKSGKVKTGKKLQIPLLTYKVEKGDTVKSLARKFYGKKSGWRDIYQANQDIVPKSKKLKAGTTLVIPVPADFG